MRGSINDPSICRPRSQIRLLSSSKRTVSQLLTRIRARAAHIGCFDATGSAGPGPRGGSRAGLRAVRGMNQRRQYPSTRASQGQHGSTYLLRRPEGVGPIRTRLGGYCIVAGEKGKRLRFCPTAGRKTLPDMALKNCSAGGTGRWRVLALRCNCFRIKDFRRLHGVLSARGPNRFQARARPFERTSRAGINRALPVTRF